MNPRFHYLVSVVFKLVLLIYLIDFTQVFVSFIWMAKHSLQLLFCYQASWLPERVCVSEFIDQIMQVLFCFCLVVNYVQSTLGPRL